MFILKSFKLKPLPKLILLGTSSYTLPNAFSSTVKSYINSTTRQFPTIVLFCSSKFHHFLKVIHLPVSVLFLSPYTALHNLPWSSLNSIIVQRVNQLRPPTIATPYSYSSPLFTETVPLSTYASLFSHLFILGLPPPRIYEYHLRQIHFCTMVKETPVKSVKRMSNSPLLRLVSPAHVPATRKVGYKTVVKQYEGNSQLTECQLCSSCVSL